MSCILYTSICKSKQMRQGIVQECKKESRKDNQGLRIPTRDTDLVTGNITSTSILSTKPIRPMIG